MSIGVVRDEVHCLLLIYFSFCFRLKFSFLVTCAWTRFSVDVASSGSLPLTVLSS